MEAKKGEGIVLRNPHAPYEKKTQYTNFKVKKHFMMKNAP